MPTQKTTRSEIIYASTRLFRRKGYYRTSMKDLTQELGLTKGAFYHHFRDKAHLMQAALEATIALAERKVFAVARDASLPLAERVGVMTAGMRKLFDPQAGGCFIANTALETAQVEDTFLAHTRAFMDGWETALVALLAAAEVPENDRLKTAQDIMAAVEGSIVLMQVYQDDAFLTRAIERLEAKILST